MATRVSSRSRIRPRTTRHPARRSRKTKDLGITGDGNDTGRPDIPSPDEHAPVLRLVGLGARGRLVVVGVELTRQAAMAGKLQLAIVAADASAHSKQKAVPLLLARGVPVIHTASASALGHAVGKDTTAVVGVVDPKLARGISAAHEAIRRQG